MKEPAGKPEAKKSKAVQVDMASPWQKYANAVLIPVIIGLTVFLLIRFRMNANADAKAADEQALTEVRQRITSMRMMDVSRLQIGADQLSTYRNSNQADTEKMIDALLDSTKDPVIRAEALVAKGDLNWLTATFPELPGATTRQSLQPTKPIDDYLTAATSAYASVLKEFPTVQPAAVSAHLGLGAIAENKRDWDEARKQYQAVIDAKSVASAFTEVAKQRLEIMKTIQDPVYIGKTKSAAAIEAMMSAMNSSTTQPTTQSSATTQPTAATQRVATTMPTTAPSSQPTR